METVDIVVIPRQAYQAKQSKKEYVLHSCDLSLLNEKCKTK